MKPLEGITVLDFSQFLSGPSAALRLGDLGARVIKIEKPESGDSCRTLYISNCQIEGDSTIFHAINRGKESVSLDLKQSGNRSALESLIKLADVLIVNFRPGVAERLGIGYSQAQKLNPHIIYGEITGYGTSGPWRDKPGQDLLLQAISGVMQLGGNGGGAPLPLGLSVADLFAGQHLAQGILACLIRREKHNCGAYVHISMLEAIMDTQFEVFTTYLNDGHEAPHRSRVNNANAYIDAPYGIYETADSYLALAMVAIPQLGKLIGCPALERYTEPASWFAQRDEIKATLAGHLRGGANAHWIGLLEPADVWCAPVLTWDQLLTEEGFQALNMLQEVVTPGGTRIKTTCCPITIDGQRYTNPQAAPKIGQHNRKYLPEDYRQVAGK